MCAEREMKEETGLEVKLLGVISVDSDPTQYALCSYPDGVVQYTNITFLARLGDIYQGVPPVTPCEESLELRWVPLRRLPEPFLLNHQWRLEKAMAHRGAFIPVR